MSAQVDADAAGTVAPGAVRSLTRRGRRSVSVRPAAARTSCSRRRQQHLDGGVRGHLDILVRRQADAAREVLGDVGDHRTTIQGRPVVPDAQIVACAPASTCTTSPVIARERSLSRNTVASATSSTVTLRRSGVWLSSSASMPLKSLVTIKDFSGMLALLESHTPLRRNVTVEEVADATVFLLSDLSRAITGEVVHVDAGAHATI